MGGSNSNYHENIVDFLKIFKPLMHLLSARGLPCQNQQKPPNSGNVYTSTLRSTSGRRITHHRRQQQRPRCMCLARQPSRHYVHWNLYYVDHMGFTKEISTMLSIYDLLRKLISFKLYSTKEIYTIPNVILWASWRYCILRNVIIWNLPRKSTSYRWCGFDPHRKFIYRSYRFY